MLWYLSITQECTMKHSWLWVTIVYCALFYALHRDAYDVNVHYLPRYIGLTNGILGILGVHWGIGLGRYVVADRTSIFYEALI